MRNNPIEQSIDGFNEALLQGLHTAYPGTIEKYDPDTKTATVKINYSDFYQTEAQNPTNEDWPPIPDCPVVFPRGGGWAFTFPLAKGDPVLVIFCERSIDEWFQGDGKKPVAPQLKTTHSESDAIVIAGLFPSQNKDGDANKTDAILSHKDGNTRLALKPGGHVDMTCTRLNVGASSASTALAKASTSDSNDTTIQTKVDILAAIFGIPPIGALPSAASGKAFTND